MNNINIRPYQTGDRAALRTLCCDVADRGLPIEHFFSDREVAADLLTKYYTDYEPESTFVAICNGRLVGYINGCTDNRRYGLVVFWLIMPLVLVKGFKRGLFLKPQIQQLLRGMLKNWRRIFVWRKKSFHSHQGHLHIGVAGDFRHQKIGRHLLKTLLDHAVHRGISEIAASVHESNQEAGVFFKAQGFTVRERAPMVQIRDGRQVHYHALLYVKAIEGH